MAEEQRNRRLVFGLLACVAVALVLWSIFNKPAQKPAAPPPVPVNVVNVVKAVAQDLQISISALGAARPWTSDTILAQANGKLLRVYFHEGSDVRAGQVLAEVDPAPYRAALTQALGTLHRDQALLAGAAANLARYRQLQQQDSIARQTLEDQQALVAQDRGVVETDQGMVATARINLGYCRIVSPISGRAGVRLVDPGNLVSAAGSMANSAANSANPATGASNGGIVVINQIEPIAVILTVPEGQFEHLSQLSNGFRKALAVAAYSQESGELLDSGTMAVANNAVDAATGTVQLKARFANRSHRLWPGQFVNVRLATDTLRQATLIPATAVNRGPRGDFAFVVENGKAVIRPLATGATQGGMTAITSGVKPGEMVVVDGQMTLKPGSAVRIVPPAREIR